MSFLFTKFSSMKLKFKPLSTYSHVSPCQILVVLGSTLLFVYLMFLNPSMELFSTLKDKYWAPTNLEPSRDISPTNISHILFSLVTGVKVWGKRKAFIDSWWQPNVTRGYLFLDKPPIDEFLPWPSSSPPYRVSENTSELEKGHTKPVMVRMVNSIFEVFREGDKGVRWYIIGFDDSIFFINNLVDVLSKYDHTKYINIGAPSETSMSNYYFSYEMGFGGGGIALSYPLAAAMVKELKGCIKRYNYVNSADLITQYCVDEFGVPLTVEKGIHQIDLGGDISGFLSSHPQTPLLSLHHLDVVDPIFPSKDTFQSVNHLMKAADFDQSRLLQQTVCYQKPQDWSFSISWGYSIQIYDKFHPRHILKRPLETFRPWRGDATPKFMFNTRDPCESIPNVLFFESVEKTSEGQIVTTYVRPSPPWKPKNSCQTITGNRSVDYFTKARVFSPTTKLKEVKIRSECCDIFSLNRTNGTVDLKLRSCKNDEIVA